MAHSFNLMVNYCHGEDKELIQLPYQLIFKKKYLTNTYDVVYFLAR